MKDSGFSGNSLWCLTPLSTILKDSGIKYNVIYLQKLPFVFGERNRDFETALENRGQISLQLLLRPVIYHSNRLHQFHQIYWVQVPLLLFPDHPFLSPL